MDDLWQKKLELKVHEHNRRLTDHDVLHTRHNETRGIVEVHTRILEAVEKRLAQGEETNAKLDRIADVMLSVEGWASKTYDVFEPLVRYGTIIVKVGAWFVIAWHGVKWVAAKIAMVWP